MNADRTSERLVAVALAGAIALNVPFLYVFGAGPGALGIPALFLYRFVVWPVLTALLALIIRRRRDGRHDGGGDPPGV
jgi:membrane protein implicated in regulation of membrane protease activity